MNLLQYEIDFVSACLVSIQKYIPVRKRNKYYFIMCKYFIKKIIQIKF